MSTFLKMPCVSFWMQIHPVLWPKDSDRAILVESGYKCCDRVFACGR